MKFFPVWNPCAPDPPYWKWFSLDRILVSFGALKKERLLNRILLTGLHEYLDFHGTIFLDSGSYNDCITGSKSMPKTPKEFLVMAEWVGADMVAHLDVPFVGFNRSFPMKKNGIY